MELVREYIEQIKKGNVKYNEIFFAEPKKVDIFMIKPTNIKIQRLLNCT